MLGVRGGAQLRDRRKTVAPRRGETSFRHLLLASSNVVAPRPNGSASLAHRVINTRNALGAWTPIREEILTWQSLHEVPLLFTEVGFPSQDGANKNRNKNLRRIA